MSDPIRVRIAPSPTGHLHLGTARTALYNYLYARKHNGTFILRLEDTDEARSKEEYTQDILDGLKWLGLNWDEGPDIGGPHPPYRQTQKEDHYVQIANQLISRGMAYFCYATSEELEGLKEEEEAAGLQPTYGREISTEQIEKFQAEGRVPAIRFIVDEPRVVSWIDAVKGEISINTSDLGGDMVIVKSSGIATYNFAVVVDDVDMQMSHVIRGEDHIHNTAKQILLYEAMGMTHPKFAHTALIFDLDRRKLSKRFHGEAVHIDRYRRDGYMPEAIVNYLTQMSWTHPDPSKEVYTLQEAGQLFDLDKLSKSPAVFDVERLKWFNGLYLRSLPLEVIVERARPYLQNFNLSEYDDESLSKIVATVREGLSTLGEIAEATKFFFEKELDLPEDLRESVLSTEKAQTVLERMLSDLGNVPFGDPKGCKSTVDSLGKELKIKGKDLFWPLRVALCGNTHGPDLGSIISVLGEKRVRDRLEKALGLCKSR